MIEGKTNVSVFKDIEKSDFLVKGIFLGFKDSNQIYVRVDAPNLGEDFYIVKVYLLDCCAFQDEKYRKV